MKYTTVTSLAPRLDNVAPSATLALTQKAAELRAAGHDVVSLTAGEPDFAPAPHVIEAAKAAMDAGHTRYTAVSGMLPLREAICDVHAKLDGLHYETNEVIVGTGAKQALYNALQALTGPGDEVVIIAPFWVSYPAMVRLAGAEPVIVTGTQDTGFIPDTETLRAAVTDATKAIVICSPANPSGACFDTAQLEGLADIVRSHPRLVVIADEIYRRISYGDAPTPTLLGTCPDIQDRVVGVDGCSKSFAMTGFRIGWACGPRNIISAMGRIQGQSTSNPSTPSQHAALAALTGDQGWVDEMVSTFATRKDFVVGRLNALPGLSCFEPRGAFYVFPSMKELIGRRLPDGMEVTNAIAFTAHLLHEHHLATVPGKPFGAPEHFRLSFAASLETLSEGLDRLERAIRTCVDIT